MRSPSSMADPSNTECAPGSRGNHLLSTVVEWSKVVGSKSLAPTVLRCSDWIRSEFFSVPDSELVPAQAEAENTKSNATVAKLMRYGFIFSPPFRAPRARGAHTPLCARRTSSSKQWMSHWRMFSSRSLVAEWPENVLLISSSRGGSYLRSTWTLFLSCSGVGLLLCSARRSGRSLQPEDA